MPLHTPEYRQFLVLLKELRTKQNISQVELAGRLKTTQQYVSRCESGQRRLDAIELDHWCEALDVSGAEFFGRIREIRQTPSLEK
ncbi:helix-turn-helix domain-containing protein [Comamonas sp. B21-038]|uniref:helix-turn-helix domain-containing protein n=1 Tax=Comamonas sp. B21-038 TaxID=2918299 RepID=UPI001EFAAC3A|nr:helix-turn-helix transcriptional regulator [Comamonas sp. B21-038]ULR90327.1 helix-turn-helix domain-containing protein [Comamonas sp. B21-038]